MQTPSVTRPDKTRGGHQAYSLPADLGAAVRATLDDWRRSRKVERLWQGDATLWTGADKQAHEITIAGGYTQAVRKSAEPAFARTLAPFGDLRVYQDSQKLYVDPVPNHAKWVEQEIIVRDHVVAAVKGERSPDQALRELQAALELSFKQAVQEVRQ